MKNADKKPIGSTSSRGSDPIKRPSNSANGVAPGNRGSAENAKLRQQQEQAAQTQAQTQIQTIANQDKDNNKGQQRKVVGPYMLGKSIGEGTFGKVRLAVHMPTGEQVAVKILEKSRIKEQADVRRVNREIKILKKSVHPNIIQLYEVLDTQNSIYLIMEYCEGGEMFDYIVQHKRVPELQACKFLHQILEGVELLHKSDVTHRDLKPENLLLKGSRDGWIVKIVDFGLSNTHEGGRLLSTACGSPCYAAPEMIAGKKYVGPQADMWSLGVILFALVCGYLPFEDQNTAQLYKKILAGDYKPAKWISDDVKDLIRKVLETDPAKRYTIDDVRAHRWCQQVRRDQLPHLEILPSDMNSELHNNVINELKGNGMDIVALNEALASKACNSNTATYHLTLNKWLQAMMKQGKRKELEKIPTGGENVVGAVMSNTTLRAGANEARAAPAAVSRPSIQDAPSGAKRITPTIEADPLEAFQNGTGPIIVPTKDATTTGVSPAPSPNAQQLHLIRKQVQQEYLLQQAQQRQDQRKQQQSIRQQQRDQQRKLLGIPSDPVNNNAVVADAGADVPAAIVSAAITEPPYLQRIDRLDRTMAANVHEQRTKLTQLQQNQEIAPMVPRRKGKVQGDTESTHKPVEPDSTANLDWQVAQQQVTPNPTAVQSVSQAVNVPRLNLQGIAIGDDTSIAATATPLVSQTSRPQSSGGGRGRNTANPKAQLAPNAAASSNGRVPSGSQSARAALPAEEPFDFSSFKAGGIALFENGIMSEVPVDPAKRVGNYNDFRGEATVAAPINLGGYGAGFGDLSLGISGVTAEIGDRPNTRRSRQRSRGDGQDSGVPARPGSAVGGMHVERDAPNTGDAAVGASAGVVYGSYDMNHMLGGEFVASNAVETSPKSATVPSESTAAVIIEAGGNPLLLTAQQATAPVVPQRSANRPAAGSGSGSNRAGRHIVQMGNQRVA